MTSVTARWTSSAARSRRRRCGGSRMRAFAIPISTRRPFARRRGRASSRDAMPREQHGLHHRGLRRLPGVLRADPLRERHDRRGAQRARLEHVRDRQMAPYARGRGGHVGVEGPLAAWPRVRALLRLPRRRDEPVVSGPRLRQPHGHAPGDSRGRLPPLEGPDRQGDRVRSRLKGRRTREALVHVLLPGLRPRAAPCVQGVVGQVRGPL
jgi:hypothetical protein